MKSSISFITPLFGYYSCKGIKRIFPDVSGTHLVFIDEKSDGFVYNPVSIQSHVSFILIASFPLHDQKLTYLVLVSP